MSEAHRSGIVTAGVIAVVLACGVPMFASGPADLAGHWIPVDTSRAATLFDVGLSDITSAGMTITVNPSTIRIMRGGLPSYFVTVIPPVTSFAVGTDAARWDDGTLTLEKSFPNGTTSRQIYSLLEPNVLVVDTAATTVRGVTSHIVQTYRRTP